MDNEYLLTCRCGQTHRVNVRQSGEIIECQCGTRLDVPGMRELRALEPAPALAPDSKSAAVWGGRQKMIFLGLVLAVVGFGAGGYFYLIKLPDRPKFDTPQFQIDALRPGEAWGYWLHVQNGVPHEQFGEIAAVTEQIRWVRREIRVALVVGIAGLVLAAAGLLVRPVVKPVNTS